MAGKSKTCGKCGEEKPLTQEFWYFDRHSRDNPRPVSGNCLECFRRRMRERYYERLKERE